MKISLFKHNEAAYVSAVNMLAETGKAAIIHPTGTGKSFIGFKLCEDNPSSTICWLSPSEYIFNTQLENLQECTDGYVPQNIKFFTYAKLMLLDDAELGEIKPDYIILDEFHRCGAEKWGDGILKLLAIFSSVPVLGLSATAIRYLDNQRDMSDELFDGNIASEMTLGEAIVRGILQAPKYVLSIYSYKQEFEKYKRKVHSAKNRAVRDECEKYLDALSRTLENAEGLDVIFDKHITDRTGKYIVFCANYEHLQEMAGKAGEWFSKVDKAPHIYVAYSEYPETSKEFAEFKKDNSDHLKLLFCIDMLNEGVHVEDICGVVLLRPTISPTIYKQQIGRALSASKKTDAVIFDIVLNIENLYSINVIQEEMQLATTYYHFMGEESQIVAEHFHIIDEVRDCVYLFDKLDDTLEASWETMYSYAEKYFLQNGDLAVPRRYKTEDGYSLGNWIQTQRKIRSHKRYGRLDDDRIARLDKIGMIWESINDRVWERNFKEAQLYFEKNGHLNTNVNYVTPSGFQLGRWICNLRSSRKNGTRASLLNQERIDALNEIGMIWDVLDYLWEDNFREAMQFFKENGHLNVPLDYISENGLKLGVWIRRLRMVRVGKAHGAALTEDKINRLNAIGMTWENKYEAAWTRGYEAARKYFEENGDLNIPIAYVTKDGYKLGAWLCDQRDKRNKLSQERKEALSRIGVVWEKADPWETRYQYAKAYYDEHGDLNMPGGYVADGMWIAKWLNEQRHVYMGRRKNKTLSSEQIEKLNSIGMRWEGRTPSKK